MLIFVLLLADLWVAKVGSNLELNSSDALWLPPSLVEIEDGSCIVTQAQLVRTGSKTLLLIDVEGHVIEPIESEYELLSRIFSQMSTLAVAVMADEVTVMKWGDDAFPACTFVRDNEGKWARNCWLDDDVVVGRSMIIDVINCVTSSCECTVPD